MVGQLFGSAHHDAIFGAANLFHHSAGALGSYAGEPRLRYHGQLPAIFLLAALVVVGSAATTSLARRRISTGEQSRAHPDNRG